MAASNAVLANAALGHLGVAGTITNLATDATAYGVALRALLPQAIDEALRAAPWRCAYTETSLTGTAIASSVTREWLYRFRLPELCVTPLRILWEGVRTPRRDQQVPFVTRSDADSTAWDIATTYAEDEYASVTTSGTVVWYRALRETVGDAPASSASDWVATSTPNGAPPHWLYTDHTDASTPTIVLAYTRSLTDPTRFDGDLERAITCLLAYHVAPQVTVNGSAVDLRRQVAATYNALASQAIAHDRRSRQADQAPASGYEAARVMRRR